MSTVPVWMQVQDICLDGSDYDSAKDWNGLVCFLFINVVLGFVGLCPCSFVREI